MPSRKAQAAVSEFALVREADLQRRPAASREDIDSMNDADLTQLARNLTNGVPMATPVFDGASEAEIKRMLQLAELPLNGRPTCTTAVPATPSSARWTVGYMYMLKLKHLSMTRCTRARPGPTAWSPQQPLGGKAQFGGQRFGEMEVLGARGLRGGPYTLQEMLTGEVG